MTRQIHEESRKYQLRQRSRPTIAPLAAAIGGVLAAGSLQAATITVDTLTDSIDAGHCSLRGALYASTGNGAVGGGCTAGEVGQDTIVFESSLSGTIALDANAGDYYDGSTLPIGESVVIDGDERITIQGTGNGPVFYQQYQSGGGFHAEEVEIHGLAISGGGGDYGGAIAVRGRELRLEDCTLTDNSAANAGGAIWHSYAGDSFARLSIVRSDISGNGTGANYIGGGAVAVVAPLHSMKVYTSTFDDNVSLAGGGAIDWRTSSGSMVLANSTSFQGNTAKYGDGGAVNIVANAGYGVGLNTRDAQFSSNSASGRGGAIAVADAGYGQNGFGKMRMRGTAFLNNSAGESGGGLSFFRGDGAGTAGDPVNYVRTEVSPYSGNPTTFIGNTAAYSGGGAEISVGDATPIELYGAEFIDNAAGDGDGGAALIGSGDSGLLMSQVTIEGNSAEGAGGGFLIVAANGGDVEGRGVEVVNNQGDYGGGMAIGAGGGSVLFDNARFMDNTAATSSGGGMEVSGTLDQFGIGASVFSGNSAAGDGGGLNLASPGSESVLAEIKYSEWSNNHSGSNGGAAFLRLGSDSQVFVENSTLSGNTSTMAGGALAAYGDFALSVKYSTVVENATDGTGGGVFTYLGGGCDVDNALFHANTGANGAEEQDLQAVIAPCAVEHSLLSGDDSFFNDVGGNILYQDPMILPLADNGGANGRTHGLAAGSPAIDAGAEGTGTPSSDQRGGPFQRVYDNGLDIGAYELQTIQDGIFSDRFETP
ncbi:choice-of-anchor Q domain-containing protein [Wenzhouxiangella sp. EGI_FJ10409]|uniref:choice-of-anchor Q domain-containing protein n=1 Tax=Wenzhouxiangella sp. EGI_FJ10409 TaxID=3243767 RepID=UPI0035DD88FF